MKPPVSHLRKHKLRSHNWPPKTSARECKVPRLPVADTDALADNSTDIPDSLLRARPPVILPLWLVDRFM
jgi:hypothetical protein